MPAPPAVPSAPPAGARRPDRARVALAAVLGLVTVGYAAVVVGGAGGPGLLGPLGTTTTVVAATAAATAMLWRANRVRGRMGLINVLIVGGLTTLAAAELVQGLGGSLPGLSAASSPSLADTGHLALDAFILAGLLLLPTVQRGLLQSARSVLDGLMVAASLLLIGWVFAVRPLAGDDLTAERLAGLALPVADVVVVTVLLYRLAILRRGGGNPGPPAITCVAMTIITVADAGSAVSTLAGSPTDGSLVDVGHFAGLAMILLVALLRIDPPATPRDAARPARDATDTPGAGRPIGMFAPYLAVLAALVLALVHQLHSGRTDAFVDGTRTVLILLVVARQLLTLRENGRLNRRLESRVAARTAELYTREQRFKALVHQSSDSLAIIDADCTVVYQSDSIERIFGWGADQFTDRWLPKVLGRRAGAQLTAAIATVRDRPYASTVVELNVLHADGRRRRAEMTITNLLANPSVEGFVLSTRDVSDSRELQERLVHDAYHDSLTGLASRALFRERLSEALADGRGGDTAVLLLDLDGFREVNDSLGHAAGDQLLVKVAARLCGSVREEDVVARFGGDEFAVLIRSVVAMADAEAVARRIVAALREPLLVEGREMHIGASIGLASAADAADREQLLRNADLAMYRAKAAGGGGFAGYHPQMLAGLVQRLELESDLRQALERGELTLHYQPTVLLAETRIVGFEALVRWRHPDRGMISPLDFIGIAESTGLIVPLGRWVLAEACRQAVAWAASTGQPPVRMAVNVSVRQFDHTDLAMMVREVLTETGMPADRLCLEMTESVLMTDTEDNLMQLLRLKALGVTLAMDDFGTGYSSLAYLGRFPLDTLKIDRSFVQRLGGDSEDTALVETIVRLGTHLGMSTVAEGIEEPGELAALRQMGCDFGQGYYFSRPVPAEEAGRLLRDGLPAAPAVTV